MGVVGKAARATLVATFAAAVALGGSGCAPAEAPARPTVSLRMHGTPGDATVVIDDQAMGTLDLVTAHGVALPPGVHHITVKADGYFPWDREVDAKLGSGIVRLEVALMPVPD